ncbi:uncharacterized protein LOC124320997 [Daphnia pulicaria]|uniref:uncharacterized protein LOC124320997 n=1 Tax=Daphnia pulicaria TaxID=35523 RepID=UPI001EEA0B3B|nr:uncharacterized protein LOC124320997 [Daphnia pulicaria]
MNGALRFFAIAFLLALCYHWLGDDDWTDMEEDTDETQEDLINKFSQSFHRKSGDQVVKGENGKFKADLEELHSRQILIEEIRHSCLPRLVCELFAMEDKSSLTDSELSLMSLISQTSLGTRASSTSNYHFAAHMGQLLVGIDGNSCQHFYPTCPISGQQALALARKIKVR